MNKFDKTYEVKAVLLLGRGQAEQEKEFVITTDATFNHGKAANVIAALWPNFRVQEVQVKEVGA